MRFAVFLILFVSPLWAFASNSETHDATNPESLNRTISITDAGVVPQTLRIANEDISVFILNDTTESLVSLEIDFGKTVVHCNNKNLKVTPDGKLTTVKPIGPRDFLATCFHEKGRYPLKFVGIKGKGPISGEVILE